MSYSNAKITQADINENNVRSASDILIGNADDNKAVFDKLPEFIAGKHNELIDELDSQHGEEIKVAVDEWLAEHPEVTTTVEDESLSYEKLIKGTLGVVIPQMFGAVGDGVADDTQALQDALDYAANNTVVLYIPAGFYYITTSLIVNSGTTIIGENTKNTTIYIKRTDTTYSYVFKADDTTDILIENLHLKGYKVNDSYGGTDGNPTLTGIMFSGDYLRVRGCKFESFPNGGIGVRNAANVYIKDCIFTDINTNGVACTRVLENIHIEDNYFYNNHSMNINFEDETPTELVHDVYVKNNTIRCDADLIKKATWGINFSTPNMVPTVAKYNNVIIDGNTIDYCVDGLSLWCIKNGVISNNIVTNSATRGLIFWSTASNFICENIKILNNVIYNSGEINIQAGKIKHLEVSGNICTHSVKYGMRFFKIFDAQIINNVIDYVAGNSLSYGMTFYFYEGDADIRVENNLIKSGRYAFEFDADAASYNAYVTVKNNYLRAETKTGFDAVAYCVFNEKAINEILIDGNILVGAITAFYQRAGTSPASVVYQRNNQGFSNN